MNQNNITFTSPQNFNGTESVNISVSDIQGGTDSQIVQVSVIAVNDNPILENIDNKTRNWLDLRWPDGDIQNSHPTCLTISMYNGVGVLGRICSLIGERGANITNIDFVDRKPDFYSIIIEMHVKDLKHLSNIMTSIEADTDIAVVTRTREVFDPSSNESPLILSNYQ